MQLDEKEKNIISEVLISGGTDPKKCMKCGKCSASCPPSYKMDILPHRFVKNVEESNIEALKESKSLWNCLSCFACVERCPRGVEPSSLVEAVRLVLIREQGKNYFKPDNIPALLELDEEIPQQLIVSALRKYSK